MAEIFYPGCRVKSGLPQASAKLAEYMKRRHGLDAVGCCKQDGKLLGPEDHPVLICNNCAKDLKAPQGYAEIRFVYELIDRDRQFRFPDYGGMKLPLQDCGHGYAGHDMEGTVRSLLRKMNVRYTELPEKAADGMDFADHTKACRDNIPKLPDGKVLVYCNICRKAYMDQGCSAVHLLDLLFKTFD